VRSTLVAATPSRSVRRSCRRSEPVGSRRLACHVDPFAR
jgi:hypothetical protein